MTLHGAGRDATDARVGRAWPERALVLEELAHEAEVRGDVRLYLLYMFVGAVQRVVVELHQVGEDDGHRARHARVAVNKDALALHSRFLDEAERFGEVLDHIHVVGVFHGDLFVGEPGSDELVGNARSHVQNVTDAAGF